jgi:pyruvate dehydrogenase E2 component (dihydrolipoamide acetyltransferase)
MATPIVMPKAGNSVEECLLTGWRVKPGDAVKVGDIVADIETDKAAFEVEGTAAGTVLALFWSEGDLVPVMQTLCVVGEAGEDPAPFRPDGAKGEGGVAAAAAPAGTAPAPAPEAAPALAPAAVAAAAVDNAPMSPRARRFVTEHPFVVPAIQGSGPGGRIVEKDVIEAYRQAPRLTPVAAKMAAEGMATPAAGTGVGGMVRAADMGSAATAPTPVAESAAPAPQPVLPVAAPAAVTEVKISNLRKIIAKRLHESLAGLAQYTLNAEADVSGLLALRKRIKAQGEALGLANVNIGDMVLFAAAKALAKHPEVNAEFDGSVIRQYAVVNLGFACDTPRGLMVPVVHGAQDMTLAELAARAKDLAKQAAAGAINPDLLRGGTFTVSNLGAFGITTFTPVINAPQVGILGVGTTVLRPVRVGEAVEYREMMQLSLTLDHRVVDGAPGARFLRTLTTLLESFDLVCVAG